nr:IS5 family transposase [Actinomadura litoris]
MTAWRTRRVGRQHRFHLVPGAPARRRCAARCTCRLPGKGGGAVVEEDGREALGQSRGGLTTKIHLLADDRARPLCRLTSPGQRGDSPMFGPVPARLRIRRRGAGHPDRVRGDKAYSSRDNRAYLRRRHIKATIAQPKDQHAHRRRKGSAGGRPPAFDKAQYRRRSAVERCVSKWKQYRAVATRYDKRDYVYNGTLTIAAIMIWLRDTVQRAIRNALAEPVPGDLQPVVWTLAVPARRPAGTRPAEVRGAPAPASRRRPAG